jgi:hypothetical protein
MAISHLAGDGVDQRAETFDLDLVAVDTQLAGAEATQVTGAGRDEGTG